MRKAYYDVTGIVAVALAICSLLPSFVPGAMSIIGLLISIVAAVLSLVPVKKCGWKYFKISTAIVVAGVLLVNDTFRLV